MINENDQSRGYRAFLVRLWQVSSGGQTAWRASVEDAHSGERRAFVNLAHLFAFLQEAVLGQLTQFQDKDPPDRLKTEFR